VEKGGALGWFYLATQCRRIQGMGRAKRFDDRRGSIHAQLADSLRPGGRVAIRNKFDIALLPGGKAAEWVPWEDPAWQFPVLASSREAVELVRYLTRRDVQVARSRMLSQPPTLPELYDLPEVLEPNPRFNLLSQRSGPASSCVLRTLPARNTRK